VAVVTGKRPVEWVAITGGGYTSSLRLIVRFADGFSAFVKVATTLDTAGWIRTERRLYEAIRGGTFLPAYYGAGEDGSDAAYPFLVLEDLSDAHWPPPWSPEQVQVVLDTLDQMHAYDGPLPADLSSVEAVLAADQGWQAVAEDPAPFLSLGLCTPTWLDAALSPLIAAAAAAPFAGDALLHLDVRSDNICFRADGRASLVDWNWACRGNPAVDVAAWAPSLCAEGGPMPETLLPHAPEFAAWLSGFWAALAGLPPPPGARHHVRELQRRQLAVALPWAARAVGLPPLH
jgi:hypothetical protein